MPHRRPLASPTHHGQIDGNPPCLVLALGVLAACGDDEDTTAGNVTVAVSADDLAAKANEACSTWVEAARKRKAEYGAVQGQAYVDQLKESAIRAREELVESLFAIQPPPAQEALYNEYPAEQVEILRLTHAAVEAWEAGGRDAFAAALARVGRAAAKAQVTAKKAGLEVCATNALSAP